MKLLHFCNLFPNKLGAYEHVLAAIGRAFAGRGDQLVVVFAAEPTPAVAALLKEQSVRWHVIEGWSDGQGGEHPWHFCIPALRILRREKPDVAAVHFGNELPSVALIAMCKVSGLGNVRWVWEQDQQIQDPGRFSAHVSKIRVASWCFDRLLAVYEGGRRSLLARSIPAHKISVIHNSVRDHISRRVPGWLRGELSLSAETVLVLSVSWFVPRKRVDHLIHAFAGVCGQGDARAALVLVGDGPQRADLEGLVALLGLQDRVRFLGTRNDVRDILAEADLLVHASKAEGCPYAISESLCAGLPAIVCDAGATSEQVVDGSSGFVLPQDDVDGFVEQLNRLVRDSALRARMSAAARERWKERYRLETAAAQYHTMYRDLAGRR